MKKSKVGFGVCLLLCFALTTGCGGKKHLKLEDIKNDTLYVSKDGTLELADVEDFDKEYYSESELKTFIKDTISSYGESGKGGTVSMEDFSVKKKTAKVLLQFDSADTYENFQGEKLQIIRSDEIEGNLVLPESFVSAKDGQKVTKNKVTEKSGLHYLITSEALDIQLEGTIVYYSDASLTGDNLIQTTGEKTAVIIYE